MSGGCSFLFDHVHIVGSEQIAFHQSPTWELSYVISGKGTRIVGDMVEPFSSGEVVLLPPNLPHCWTFDERICDSEGKIENITVLFDEALLSRCADSFAEMKECVQQVRECCHAVKFEGQAEMALQGTMRSMVLQNEVERLASMIRLLGIIASASSSTRIVGCTNRPNRGIARMQDVSRYMVSNYQRKITLDEVASHVGMNRSAFCTFFKREKGISFFASLNAYRIECSCLMLRDTSKPISEICFAVGFDDVPYYNRIFKRQKGVTPKEYRMQEQNANGIKG